VIHVAVDTNLEALIKNDTDATLKAAADSVLVLMKAAARTSSVKSFVLTSSCVTTIVPEYGKDVVVSLADFGRHLIPQARATPVDSPKRGPAVCEWNFVALYRGFDLMISSDFATKVHGELEAWRYWKEAQVRKRGCDLWS